MLKPPSPPPESLHTMTKLSTSRNNSTSHTTVTESPLAHSESEKQLVKFNVPAMTLYSDKISSSMAARLATSLLCHVLFLKSQIPFPVVQLARMATPQSNARAAKRREGLMDAVDILTSHLQTTFTALSTAYALCQERRTINNAEDGSHAPVTEIAYMAYVLGSSVGAAKARVMFALSGLEVKMWGARTEEDGIKVSVSDVGESDDDSSGFSEEEAEDKADKIASNDEEQPDDSEDRPASPPPPSRSPSPVSRPASPLTSIVNNQPSTAPFRIAVSPPTTAVGEKSPKPTLSSSLTLSENIPPSAPPRRRPLSVLKPSAQQASPSRRVLSSRTDGENAQPRLRSGQSINAPLTRLPLSQKAAPKATPQPAQSYDEEQQVLRAADRLLSRTLAKACAEDDGGLSSELAPTQTHVLLRAPRCFSHPAWVPRQNLTRTLESQLQVFLEDSIQDQSEDATSAVPKKTRRLGVRTEGVWVTCANGGTPKTPQTKEKDESVHEDDEMIWWMWNGKIVGFSDW